MTTLADLGFKLTVDNQASAALADATAKLKQYATEADKAVKATGQTDTAVKATTRSAASLANALDGPTLAANKLAAAQAKVVAAQGAFTSAAAVGSDAVNKQATVISVLQARADAAQATLNKVTEAQTKGAGAAELLSIAQGKTIKSFDAGVKSSGNLSAAMRGVSTQAVDVFQQLATGAPIMTTFIQQGSQVYQQAQVMGVGFAQLAKGIGSFVISMVAANPVVATIGAIVVATVALGAASENSQRQLISFQNTLRATRDDYASLAQASIATARTFAANSTAGTSDSLAASKIISGASNFSGSQAALKDLLELSNDLAAVWGKTLPESAKDLVDAMKNPAAAAQKWADQGFRGFNQQLADMVKNLQAAGNKAAAFELVQNRLGAGAKGAADSQTTLSRALTNLSNAFTVAAQSIVTAVDYAITKIGIVITALSKLVPQSGGSISGASAGSTSSTVVQPNTQLPSAVRDQIYSIAERQNYGGTAELSGLQADFATQVAFHESRGLQSVISPKGAQGVMQLMPSTAAGLGVNAADQQQNIQGGLQLIAQLWTKYGGNPALVAMAYNWGAGNVDAFLSGNKTLAQVPVETSNYVQSVTGTSVGSIRAGSGIAGANAGGFGSVTTPPITSVKEAAVGGPGAVADQLNDLLKLADSLDTISAKRKVLAAESKQLSDELAKPGMLSVETYTKLSESLDIVNGRQATLRTATEEVNKTLADQAAIAGQDGAAAQQIAQTMQQLDNASIAATGHVASLADKQKALGLIARTLNSELANNVQQTERQVLANNNSLAAVEAGGQALDDYNAAIKAQTDALAFGAKGTEAYNTAVIVLTASNKNVAQSQRDVTAAQDINGFQKQLDMLTLEGQLIGATVEQRNREIAVMQERQHLGLALGQQAEKEQQQALDNAAAVADMQTALTRNKQALSDVANAFTSAFDTIGNAITNALIQGQGAAINWRNVMLSIAQQVLQAFLKFAILNPLLNSLFGQSNTTLGGIGGALGGLGGAAGVAGSIGGVTSGGGGGLFDNVSNLFQIGSLGDKLGLTNFGQTLGITGNNGLLSGVSSFLNGGLFGTSTAEAANLGLAGGLGATGDAALLPSLATTQATGLFGGASIGTLLGGAGAGFGLGSLAGGYLQGSMGKTGPGPTIGAAVGTAIGTAILPGIGSIVGGLLGGAGGSLFGPKAASPYSIQQVSVDSSGYLSAGESQTQLIDETGAAKTEIGQFNAALQQLGVTIDTFNTKFGNFTKNSGGTHQFAIGADYDPNDTGTNVIGTSLSSLLPQVSFTSGDADLAKFLSGKSYGSLDALAQGVQDFQKAQAEIKQAQADIVAFLASVNSELGGIGKTSGSVNDSIAQVNAQFDQVDATVQRLLATNAANDNQTQDLIKAENDLSDARSNAVAKIQAAAAATVQATDIGLNLRTASAQLSLGGAIDPKGLALTSFDLTTATQQREQLKQSLVGLFGDAYTATQGFAEQMGLLESTLGVERLAIAKQYDDQIAATAKATADAQAKAAAAANANDMDMRFRIATAQLSLGGAIDPKSLALNKFDYSAQQQRDQLKQSLVESFGDAYTGTVSFLEQMTLLEQTLGVERLTVAKQYDDQIVASAKEAADQAAAAHDQAAQTAAGAIASIAGYIGKFQVGGDSPLSKQSQFDIASRQFDAVSGAAAAGDFNSVQQFTGFADNLASSARGLYGSGAGYAQVIDRIMAGASQIVAQGPDALTASVVRSELRTATQVLGDKLDIVAEAVVALQVALRQQAEAPRRAA